MIQAYDSAYSALTSVANVLINVERNQAGPVFQPSATYQQDISQGFGVGDVIVKVTAVDTVYNVRNLLKMNYLISL